MPRRPTMVAVFSHFSGALLCSSGGHRWTDFPRGCHGIDTPVTEQSEPFRIAIAVFVRGHVLLQATWGVRKARGWARLRLRATAGALAGAGGSVDLMLASGLSAATSKTRDLSSSGVALLSLFSGSGKYHKDHRFSIENSQPDRLRRESCHCPANRFRHSPRQGIYSSYLRYLKRASSFGVPCSAPPSLPGCH
jgi:hypothetical protein